MGANAQTAVPVFTAGQVLTAAQQNQINTGIPVFATTVTRDAAFGGTGEKTLAEGQFAFLEDSNTTQYYDGSNWQSVGVTPGLVCVKAETAFTTSSSITADNVFTSSYTNYLLQIRMTSSTNTSSRLRLRVGGVAASGANYNYQRLQANSTTVAGLRESSITYFDLEAVNGAFFTTDVIQFFAPALAEPTNITMFQDLSNGAYTSPILTIHAGNHTVATAYDGFEFFPVSGTFTGTYTVYGYGKAV